MKEMFLYSFFKKTCVNYCFVMGNVDKFPLYKIIVKSLKGTIHNGDWERIVETEIKGKHLFLFLRRYDVINVVLQNIILTNYLISLYKIFRQITVHWKMHCNI